MAKNLKLQIKNAQLAKALSKLKKPENEPEQKAEASSQAAETGAGKDKLPKKPEAQVIRKAADVRAEAERIKNGDHKPEAKKAAPVKMAAPKEELHPTPAAAVEKEPVATPPVEAQPEEKIHIGQIIKRVPKQQEHVQEKPQTKSEQDSKEQPLSSSTESPKQSGFKDKKDVKEIKPAVKKTQSFKPFDSRDRLGLRADNDSSQLWRRRKPHKFKRSQETRIEPTRPTAISVRLPISVKDLAHEMKLKGSQLVQKLFLEGMVITVNDYIDDSMVLEILGQEFGVTITIDTSEEDRLQITGRTIREEIAETPTSQLINRAPIIAFMGHVDHGKTSLVDFIRKSNIASGEAGAITQHIGAFRVHTSHGDLAILDTPGHEAFSLMRERGAAVTDIIILVVAGDEGIKPQTDEAIRHAREANVPIIVAINKSDKPDFNPEEVYRQLADRNLLPEAWGGSVLTVKCSAKTGAGVSDLLETTALQAEILELRANPESRARGTVIESELHKGLGCVATVLVQNGTLKLGDALVFGNIWGRVKTMHDDHGKTITAAGPSTPVRITGLSGLPSAGSECIVVDSEKEARSLAEDRLSGEKRAALKIKAVEGFDALLQRESEMQLKKVMAIIIRADVQGSVEALKNSLMKIKSSKIELNVVSAAVGEVSESDVELAAASGAVIIAFHTHIESHAESIIKREKVVVRSHDIIYHVVDDVRSLMKDRLDKVRHEEYNGAAEVKQVFKSSHLGSIAGCTITDGSIARDNFAKVERDGEIVWEGNISSLKRLKDDVKEVTKGYECGILLQKYSGYQVGDKIKAYKVTYISQDL